MSIGRFHDSVMREQLITDAAKVGRDGVFTTSSDKSEDAVLFLGLCVWCVCNEWKHMFRPSLIFYQSHFEPLGT